MSTQRAAKTLQWPDTAANGHVPKRVIYPYSDGKPMAESPDHVAELIRSFLTLQDHYAADARVYVGADMFLYYERGNCAAAVAPDVYMAEGVSKRRRRKNYKLWEERAAAAESRVAIETAARRAAERRVAVEAEARRAAETRVAELEALLRERRLPAPEV